MWSAVDFLTRVLLPLASSHFLCLSASQPTYLELASILGAPCWPRRGHNVWNTSRGEEPLGDTVCSGLSEVLSGCRLLCKISAWKLFFNITKPFFFVVFFYAEKFFTHFHLILPPHIKIMWDLLLSVRILWRFSQSRCANNALFQPVALRDL